jgi:hypothetical protein
MERGRDYGYVPFGGVSIEEQQVTARSACDYLRSVLETGTIIDGHDRDAVQAVYDAGVFQQVLPEDERFSGSKLIAALSVKNLLPSSLQAVAEAHSSIVEIISSGK